MVNPVYKPILRKFINRGILLIGMDVHSLRIQEVLIDIAIFVADYGRKPFYATALSNKLGMKPTDPTLNQVLNYLKDQSILEPAGNAGKTKFYTVNKRRLRDFVDELPFVLKL